MMCRYAFWLLLSVSSAVCQMQQLSEGSKCWVQEKNGTCVNLFRCSTAATYHLNRNAGHLSAIQNLPPPQLCSYRQDGEPIVCCTDCYLDNTERLKEQVVMVFGVKYKKDGPKAWKKCLEYFRDLPYPCHGLSSDQFKISRSHKRKCDVLLQESYGIGGYAAQEGQYPHMALLGYGADRESAQWLCGGSVISERYILTAAHCVSTPLLGNVSFAALGILNRSELKDYWKVYRIRRIVKHPEYRPPHKYHDIALLETDTEINFGKNLLPACLDVGKTGKWRGVAPGWGRLGHKKAVADNLMVMELDEYNSTQCAAMYPPHRLLRNGYDSMTQMCYGRHDKVVDTCEGDSGGPLQTDMSGCVHYVVGVTSYGKNCGIPGNAGMYTRVEHYVPWIESVVWPNA